MNSLSGTRTEANLMAAFDGESQAMTKYTLFAHKAKKDGYNDIAKIFEATANNERAHAEIWYKLIHNSDIPSTDQNLQNGVDSEYFEWNNMYPEFAKVAKEEGFDNIAWLFEEVAKIEEQHEARYKNLLQDVKQGTVFSKEGDTIWICTNCGHVVVGKTAPTVCPVCKQPQAYYMEKTTN
jgi:rubrerythrin